MNEERYICLIHQPYSHYVYLGIEDDVQARLEFLQDANPVELEVVFIAGAPNQGLADRLYARILIEFSLQPVHDNWYTISTDNLNRAPTDIVEIAHTWGLVEKPRPAIRSRYYEGIMASLHITEWDGAPDEQ